MKEFFRALKHSVTKLEEREHELITKYTHHKLKKYHKWNRVMPILILICGLIVGVLYFYFELPYQKLFVFILVIFILFSFEASARHHKSYHKEFKKRKIK